MKGHFWKDDVHHIYLFHKIEAATPFHPFRVERSGFISLPPDHIQEPWIKAAKPWNLEINIQIWKQTLCGGLFPKMYGGQICDLKKSIKIPKPTPPQGLPDTSPTAHFAATDASSSAVWIVWHTCEFMRPSPVRWPKMPKKTRLWDIQ